MKGLILGKFMPPHQGHLALWRFAMQQCDQLTILVESRPDEPISAEHRKRWIKEELSFYWADRCQLNIQVLEGDHPQTPEQHPDFWNYWETLLWPYAKEATHLFASDDYGLPLSKTLNLEWVPFERHPIPTSATQLRQTPWQAWSYWLDAVKKDCAKRIVLLGPESTGKSTIGNKLAQHYQTVFVPEYAEHWIRRKNISTQHLRYEDYDQFLRGQKASRLSMATRANRFYIEDSNALTTLLYEQITFGQARSSTLEAAKHDVPDAVLLFNPQHAPWVTDAHRGHEEPDRMGFLTQIQSFMAEHWPRTEIGMIDGKNWLAREQQALDLVAGWESEWMHQPFREWVHGLEHTDPIAYKKQSSSSKRTP